MRRPSGIIWLLATAVLGAPATAEEGAPPAGVVLLRRCSIDYERATAVGTNQSLNMGLIKECLVRPGDRVKAGQVLGRLFNNDVLAELESRVVGVGSSEIAIRQREAALQVEQAKLDRAEVLYRRKALSVQDYQIQKLARKTMELELQAATQDRLMAEAQVQVAKANLAARDIVSPHDGIVVEIYKNVGESIMTGTPVYRVVDIDRLRVVGYLDVADAWRVRPGQTVRIVPDLDGDDLPIEHETFLGKITFVDSEIDPKTRTCRVFAEVENRDGLLRSGLECRMEIALGGPTGARADASGPATGRPPGAETRSRSSPATPGEGLAQGDRGR